MVSSASSCHCTVRGARRGLLVFWPGTYDSLLLPRAVPFDASRDSLLDGEVLLSAFIALAQERARWMQGCVPTSDLTLVGASSHARSIVQTTRAQIDFLLYCFW